MRRTKLKQKSGSRTALIKQAIQDVLRLLGVYRDGGCVLRNVRNCGGEATVILVENKKGLLIQQIESNNIIQYDHLITRANSATYADFRLGVCICQPCHFWKKYHEKEYDKLVKTIISKDRVALWERAEEYRSQHRTEKMDWNMQLVGLQLMLKDYE